MTSKIKLDTAELDKIVRDSNKNVIDILSSIAFDIEGDAKQTAPVDTGALKNSIYVRLKGGGGSRPGDIRMQPKASMVEIPAPTGKTIAVVGSGLDYAVHQELGTYKMSAQPFLGPAVEKNASDLKEGITWRRMFT